MRACHFFVRGLGLPCFSSLLAAAAFWSARLTAADFFPGLGLQLPSSRGAFPGTGSKPGQQREVRFADFADDFFAVFSADFVAMESETLVAAAASTVMAKIV
jgi:hypothetical protein